jgi:hypothetical protein
MLRTMAKRIGFERRRVDQARRPTID